MKANAKILFYQVCWKTINFCSISCHVEFVPPVLPAPPPNELNFVGDDNSEVMLKGLVDEVDFVDVIYAEFNDISRSNTVRCSSITNGSGRVSVNTVADKRYNTVF